MIPPIGRTHYPQRTAGVGRPPSSPGQVRKPGTNPTAASLGPACRHARRSPSADRLARRRHGSGRQFAAGTRRLLESFGGLCHRPNGTHRRARTVAVGPRQATRAARGDLRIRRAVSACLFEMARSVQKNILGESATEQRFLRGLVRGQSTHPPADVSSEFPLGNFRARTFASCRKTAQDRLPHRQRSPEESSFVSHEAADSIRWYVPEGLTDLDLETLALPS